MGAPRRFQCKREPKHRWAVAKLNPFGTSSTVLAAKTKYKGVITTGAKDQAGNQLDQDPTTTASLQQKGWTFTTKG